MVIGLENSLRSGQNNETQQTDFAYWVQVLVIVLSAIFQANANRLWAESRILRKVQRRTQEDFMGTIRSHTVNEAFSELFISLSKGRHNTYSRCFPHLFEIFLIGTDICATWYDPMLRILNSDAVVGLRILTLWGSFHVVGARPLSVSELSLFGGALIAYLSSFVVFGTGRLRVSDEIAAILTNIRVGCLVLLSGMELVKLCRALFGKGSTDISTIAVAIQEGNIKAGSRQDLRLQDVLKECENSTDADRKRSYHGLMWDEWGQVAVIVFVFATNSPAWGELTSEEFPRVFVLEGFDFVAAVLFFLNRTLVERMLFKELMQIAYEKTRRG